MSNTELKNEKRRVYLDNAATTAVDPAVLEEMLPCFTQFYGNPSSVHVFGREAKKLVDAARGRVANAIGAKPNEIIFTAGGTESDNTAIIGAVHLGTGKHIITTKVEHHAVLHTCERLAKQGYRITYLPVDEYGIVSVADVENAICDDTALVSVMFANNEVGSIMPIAQIGALCRERGVLFHTDAVQAIGHVPVNVDEMCIDMLSLSAHKFHGPKGVGALYVRSGIKLPPFIVGGAQESKKRAGTENVPGIVGLGKAIELACGDITNKVRELTKKRDRLMKGIENAIDDVKLNGHPTNRLPGNVNYSIRFIEGEGILLMLDMFGIAASSGSACTSGSLDPSHVLLAMGLDHATAHGSVRMTLSEETSFDDVDYVVEKLKFTAERLREMSPLYVKKGN